MPTVSRSLLVALVLVCKQLLDIDGPSHLESCSTAGEISKGIVRPDILFVAMRTVLCHRFRTGVAPTNLELGQTQFIDVKLNGCCMVSLDEGWAVGDRGLILSTRDGGKTWNPVSSGVAHPLHAVAVKDKRKGLIVGGTIQPYSQRSQGIVLTTEDGGKTWKRSDQQELPRLIGMQEVEAGHWIAWGDYSSIYGTSIFETIDHGRRWSPVDSNFGHIQSAAWRDRSQGFVIDRLSRVYRVDAMMNMELLPLGGDIHRPFRCIRYAESGWWIVGAAGQVIHSQDGVRWRSVDFARDGWRPRTARSHGDLLFRTQRLVGWESWECCVVQSRWW